MDMLHKGSGLDVGPTVKICLPEGKGHTVGDDGQPGSAHKSGEHGENDEQHLRREATEVGCALQQPGQSQGEGGLDPKCDPGSSHISNTKNMVFEGKAAGRTTRYSHLANSMDLLSIHRIYQSPA